MELVVVAVSGVQRFIGESRSTADLFAGSELISELANAMVSVIPDTAELVLPSGRASLSAVPNRVVVLADQRGADLAAAMAARAHATWKEWLDTALANFAEDKRVSPGFPAIQWVVVPAEENDYPRAWAKAQDALRARKRIRDFPAYRARQDGICSLTGRWPALTAPTSPGSRPALRRGESLSAAGQVKRRYARDQDERFPSTWSIASAPYRDAIIRVGEDHEKLWDAVVDLNSAVESLRKSVHPEVRAAFRWGNGALPGMANSRDDALAWLRKLEGSWCSPDTWEPSKLRRGNNLEDDPAEALCAPGRIAAAEIEKAAGKAAIPGLTPYLAVLAQDADRMGERFGTFPDETDPAGWQRKLSEALARVARAQVSEIQSVHLGRVVYAGGDDLLALIPASRALAAARAANELFASDQALNELADRPSASSAIVFFHASWPLQSAIAASHELLKEAKERARPGLGVTVLSRGGERTQLVVPWQDLGADPVVPMIDHLQGLTTAISGPLSGLLAAGLEADREALGELSREWLPRELARRALRHGYGVEEAQGAGRRLAALASAPAGRGFADCAASVLIARFIAGQGRVAT